MEIYGELFAVTLCNLPASLKHLSHLDLGPGCPPDHCYCPNAESAQVDARSAHLRHPCHYCDPCTYIGTLDLWEQNQTFLVHCEQRRP